MAHLTKTQTAQFFDEGYVMVPDLFRPEELEPVRQEIAAIIDVTASRLQAEGKLTDLHAEAPLETRLTLLAADHPELVNTFFGAIEGRAGGGHTGPAMFGLLTHPTLLDAMESLVGPEIVASSVYRIRPKIPGYGRGIVPWHQDSGYFSAHCDLSLIVTCWIPLVDATEENGCLQVLPRTHESGIARHHTGGNAGFLVIEDNDLPASPVQAVTVPVPLGGALLLTNMTPHCSLPNSSDVVRWSVDLRYQGADVPTNAFQEPEEYQPNAPDDPDRLLCPRSGFRRAQPITPRDRLDLGTVPGTARPLRCGSSGCRFSRLAAGHDFLTLKRQNNDDLGRW